MVKCNIPKVLTCNFPLKIYIFKLQKQIFKFVIEILTGLLSDLGNCHCLRQEISELQNSEGIG